jgi:hypothetical protein
MMKTLSLPSFAAYNHVPDDALFSGSHCASAARLAEDSIVRMLATKADLLAISEAERNGILDAVGFLPRNLCRESFDPGGRPRFPMV